ncbi:MAG: 5-(carboxyamino)imidazole ribonucleotide mutase [Nitrospinae bacterium]|nr:5-(carboxyamino)imidazole ribonucleotide mutase [Nitrospinota bacterium]MBF0633028.1 5-(carboxyamino)imidazole ribonucleotide mutase [Nitrospinota bacterium]
MDVLILLGSESDLETGQEATKIFDEFDISYELHIASAHRTPSKVRSLVKRAETKGAKAVIAGAGMSAHLAGVVAGETLLPVIGIPMAGGPLNGIDALLSTVNMPGGVPVAAVSIGKAGGKNAALFAARIMALTDKRLMAKLEEYRDKMKEAVEESDRRISGTGRKKA